MRNLCAGWVVDACYSNLLHALVSSRLSRNRLLIYVRIDPACKVIAYSDYTLLSVARSNHDGDVVTHSNRAPPTSMTLAPLRSYQHESARFHTGMTCVCARQIKMACPIPVGHRTCTSECPGGTVLEALIHHFSPLVDVDCFANGDVGSLLDS